MIIFSYRPVRFVVSGGTAAVVDLTVLYFLTDILGLWYLISAVLAFLLALGISFTLQKYWTYADYSKIDWGRQALFYGLVSVVNIGLNTLGLYFLVEFFHWHYLLAQIVTGVLIAMTSFFVYGHFIFNQI